MHPKPLVILLIEDNPGDARLIQEYLDIPSRYIEKLVHVNCLQKAISFLEKESVDAILLDLNLPDSNGESTFDLLIEKYAYIPVIILTGIEDEKIASKIVRNGAQDFLVKGEINYELLKHAIRYAIERKRKQNFDQLLMKTRFEIIQYAANHSFKETLRKAIDHITDLAESPVGFFHFVDEGQNAVNLQIWSSNTVKKFCSLSVDTVHYDIDKAGAWVECIRTGKTVIHNDFAKVPDRKGFPKGHVQIKKQMLVPVIRKGKTVAICGVGNKLGDFSTGDAHLVERLSDAIWELVQQKKVEEDLANERSELEALVYSIGEAVIATDRDCRITRMNHVAELLTGWGEYEAIGHLLVDVFRTFDEESGNPIECPVKKVLETGIKPEEPEYIELINRSGRKISIINSVSTISDHRGNTTGAVLVFHDQTEQRIAEKMTALRFRLVEYSYSHTLDELLTHALDQVGKLVESPIGFYHFVDADENSLTLQEWSTRTKQEFCKAEGKGSHYEIAKAGVWVDCVRERKPVVHNDYTSLLHKKGLPEGHAPVMRELVVPVIRNEKIVSILGVGNKQTDYTDDDVKIVSYAADVTWSIIAQKHTEMMLRQERDRTAKYFEIAKVMMLVLDDEGNIQDINEEGLRILEYEHKYDLVGKNWFKEFTKQSERESLLNIHLMNVNSGKDLKNYFENSIITRTGKERIIAWHNTTLRKKAGENIGTLSSGEDITEKRLAQKHREFLLDLSRKASAVTDLNDLLSLIANQLLAILPNGISSSIFIVDDENDRATLEACAGFDEKKMIGNILPLNESFIGEVVKHRRPMLISDTTNDPLFKGNLVPGAESIISTMAVPIVFQNKAIGAMFVDSNTKKYAYTDRDLETMESVANQISGNIANAKLNARIQEQSKRIIEEQKNAQNYLDIANVMITVLDRSGNITLVNKKGAELLGYQESEIIGKNWFDLCIPEPVRQRSIDLFDKFFADEEQEGPEFDQVVVTRNGEPRILRAHSTAIRDENGTIIASLTSGDDVTDRVKAEKALHQFKNIVSSSTDMMALLSADLHYLAANEAYANAFNLTTDSIVGMKLDQLFDQKVVETKLLPGINQCLQGKIVNIQDWLTIPEYGRRYIDRTYFPYFTEDKSVEGIVVNARNITDKLESEEALRQFKHIVSSSSDMMAIVDLDCVYLSANAAYASAFGLAPDELVGKYARDLFDDQFFDEVILPRIERCFSGEEVVFQEWISFPKTEKKYMEIHYYPYRDSEKNVIGLVVNRRDITERYKASEALRESEEKNRNIIENSSNMFYMHAPDGEVNFVSPQCEQILGYSPEELQDTSLWSAMIWDKKQIKMAHDFTDQMKEKKVAAPPYEMQLIHKSGSRIWVEVRETPLVIDDQIVAIIGSMNDITERKLAEKEKTATIHQLEIAHSDLRQSYNSILETMDETIRTISKTVEVRDPYTAGHHQRVSALSKAIAVELNLDDEAVKAVEMAGIIHDLGKIQIPAEILSKPGKLTDIEFKMVKMHPAIGYQLLKNINFPWPLAEIIHQHHEKLDGSGYPNGLKGDDIAFESRILAVADIVEAMASHRPYRPALGLEAALEEITRESGKTLDEDVVNACKKIFAGGFTFEN